MRVPDEIAGGSAPDHGSNEDLGRAHEVATGAELEQWSRLLTDRHPYLDQFVRSASCALFRVDIVRYLHVTHFQEVRQWVPTRPA